MKRIFITGSTGCIGTSTVNYLLSQGVERVYGFNRSAPQHPVQDRFEVLVGDITDSNSLREALRSVQPDRIIHLAALQTPDCQASPFFGMNVNLVATANLLQIVAEECKGLERFVFASSAAVHGPRGLHPEGSVGPNALYAPPNLYGYWKTAGEGMAQAFQMETGIPTVSLRLATTYGPGRDRGLTSAPTSAMKACVLGFDYQIPYQGREHYHYVDDVGCGFAEAAVSPFQGYDAFHLPGTTIEITEFCKHIENKASHMGIENHGSVSVMPGASVMPFTCDLDHGPTLLQFPRMSLTPVENGILKSLELFSTQLIDGSLELPTP